MKNNILIIDLLKIIANVNIIDTRNIENYNNNHLPGAKNIPYPRIATTPERYLNKKDIYYIYCQKGIKTPRLCQMLLAQNYKVVNIVGGYEAWILEK